MACLALYRGRSEKAFLLLGNFLCAREMRTAPGEVPFFSGEAVSMRQLQRSL